jgi:Holliday junction resolvasome RuvABC DNA-binding subunit
MNQFKDELRYRRENNIGTELTMSQVVFRLNLIGYKLDRKMDCRGMAKWMTGERAGETYHCLTTGIIEADTKRSAFHFEARRDKNFDELQDMRKTGIYVPMANGYFFEL